MAETSPKKKIILGVERERDRKIEREGKRERMREKEKEKERKRDNRIFFFGGESCGLEIYKKHAETPPCGLSPTRKGLHTPDALISGYFQFVCLGELPPFARRDSRVTRT